MVGRAQESIASLGALCCALASGNAIAGVGTQTVGWALTLELAYSKGPLSPSAPRYYCASFNLCFGVLAVEGKGSGTANHSKINMLCRKAFLRVFPSFRSSRASIEAFSIFPWDVACGNCAEANPPVSSLLSSHRPTLASQLQAIA
jgi:hypothetical protein